MSDTVEQGDGIARVTDIPAADVCPEWHRHTRCPAGYVSWHSWAERKTRTHYQVRCPRCGFLCIWKKRKAPLTHEQLTALFVAGGSA